MQVKAQHSQKIIIAIGAFCLGLIVPLFGLYFGLLPVDQESDTFVGPEGSRVELVKASQSAQSGDAYYFYQDADREHKLLIARSLTGGNGSVTNPFDSVFYTDAILSPDRRWVALPATCWEDTCLRMYDVKNQSLHWVDHAAMEVSWLPDGRLRAEGGCATPRVVECGPYESISAAEPWKMHQVQ